MFCNGLHKQWRYAVADLPNSFLEFAGEYEIIGEGAEALELRKREPPSFFPMHRPMHSEISVVAPYSSCRLIGIELHGVKPLARDVA